MLKNYFTTAFRSLWNNKGYSLINILGLAIGIAAFLMITLYVFHELSFDRYHEKSNRIYRIVENLDTDTEQLFQSTSSPPMGPNLAKDFPEVEDYVRFQGRGYLIKKGNEVLFDRNCLLSDPSIFNVFSFRLIQGDAKTALELPNSIVLTETTAKKYFGDDDPMGQSLEMNKELYKITGVVEDVRENSHFNFNILVSSSTFFSKQNGRENTAWFWNGFHTYLLLREGEDAIAKVRAKMPEFIETHIGKQAREYKMHYSSLPLQPLTSIYLEKPRSWENGKRGSQSNIYVLSIVGIFILAIACFNYVNLATARASRRLKEVGLRKVLGAQRPALISQFVGEAMLVAMVAMAIGVTATLLLLPKFNTLVESSVRFELGSPGMIWMIIALLTIVLGVLSGAYPALVVSRFQPVQILKQNSGTRFGSAWLRTTLVSGQFAVSIIMIAGTILVYRQLSFMRSVNLGFDKESMMILSYRGGWNLNDHIEAVKGELKNIPGIVQVTATGSVPGESTNNLGTQIEAVDGSMSQTNINTSAFDYDYLSVFNIKVVAGRAFSRDFPADDTTAFMINLAAARSLGFTPEAAIGKKVNQQGKDGSIVGVVEDYHYRSLHTAVEPLLIHVNKNWYSKLVLKVKSSDLQTTVGETEKKWKTLAPDLPFTYSFLDEDFNRLYKSEDQLSKVISIFSGLAIFIACLGLIGLTSFSVERRFKEIGIRKVLGSSVSGVVVLIAREFMGLVLVSFLIAIPATWYLVSLWLRNFTDRITIDPVTFILSGISVFMLAGLVISYLSARAALANPVDSLRVE